MSKSMAGKPDKKTTANRVNARDSLAILHDAGVRPTVTKTKGTGSTNYDDERRRLEQQLKIEESQPAIQTVSEFLSLVRLAHSRA